jgi:multisubunit Na+/H+ antiporter MnhB subunit
MAHRGLQARVVVAMSILFGFYVLVAAFFAPIVGVPVVITGGVLIVGVQNVVGKKPALQSVDGASSAANEVCSRPFSRRTRRPKSASIDSPRWPTERSASSTLRSCFPLS